MNADSEINDFMLELSGFLKEMFCPFPNFISGHISNRFQTVQSRTLLLNYLLSEFMAMKMVQKLRPKEEMIIEIVSILFIKQFRYKSEKLFFF